MFSRCSTLRQYNFYNFRAFAASTEFNSIKQKAEINFVMWTIKHIVWVLIERFYSSLRCEMEAHEAQTINCQPTKSTRTNWIFRISLQDLSVVKLNSKLNASFAFLNTNNTQQLSRKVRKTKEKREARKSPMTAQHLFYFRVTSIDFERLLCTAVCSGW